MGLINRLNDNEKSGILYFYIHFVTEVICFFILTGYAGDRAEIWLLFLTYDMLAFVPQAVIGCFSDRHPGVSLAVPGIILLTAALYISEHSGNPYISLAVMCAGNCLVHVNGAETTLRTAEGKLSGSALFVSGGSFGVVTGKLLAKAARPCWPLMILALTALPPAILAQRYITGSSIPYKQQCREFRYARLEIPAGLVICMTVLIVAVRGFMGYGIPTSWNKSVFQTIMLFSFMGMGKALGGIIADRAGFRKTAVLSIALAVPFLMFGDNLMMVSLIGVMLFSMTMAITLGILVSVMPGTPGLAFGWTTIGLFLGSAPVFFFKFITVRANCIMIAALSAVCLAFMWIIIRKDDESE